MKKVIGSILVCILVGCASHSVQKPGETVAAPEVIAPAVPETFDVSKGVDLHWLDGTPPPVVRGELGRAVAGGCDSEGYDFRAGG